MISRKALSNGSNEGQSPRLKKPVFLIGQWNSGKGEQGITTIDS
jgi:hypothetical protein